ncbi:13167_t:CDS:1, partial [Dentiscutata erythropus]
VINGDMETEKERKACIEHEHSRRQDKLNTETMDEQEERLARDHDIKRK